jgi:glycosyltransferase involved in cell wall biosynthesis
MKVHIVTVSSGWILQKIAERTATGGNYECEGVTFAVGHQPDPTADVNYYCDLQNCYYGTKTYMDVAYFTHADMNSKHWLKTLLITRNADRLSGIVCMNKRYEDMIVEGGYPKEKIRTIVPGQTKDMFPLKKTVIGIASRGGFPGYGDDFLQDFFDRFGSFCTEQYKFKFIGQGWEVLKGVADKWEVDMEVCSNEDYSYYPTFYQSLDYLLVPGLWTAGPIAVQEALSTGIPIISADVGFAGYEFQVEHTFPPGDAKALYRILLDIRLPIWKRRVQVESMSWRSYAKQLVEFFNYLEDLDD